MRHPKKRVNHHHIISYKATKLLNITLKEGKNGICIEADKWFHRRAEEPLENQSGNPYLRSTNDGKKEYI